ncbi:GNAT family N-acetyltransferase [Gloeothece verrucosa]|uniref:N-acetyltransferase domain-containing protein n=1 Tax=Gloeothece verrucosa (strain PCC 7822) TaxID=497965 RepID=E0UJM8_GLOV7|nr:GNAT family N-acetyltransferase [Gloeothece verrucosa]ADN12272.1 hypothetical protein Cyan7822_0222 [Gloeothece verrucosa PCC 7822]
MTSDLGYEIFTVQEAPHLFNRKPNKNFTIQVWPSFMSYCPEPQERQKASSKKQIYSDFSIIVVESGTGRLIARGIGIPLAWEGDFDQLPDRGLDWAIDQGTEDHLQGRQPTLLCARSIAVIPEYRNKHLSSLLIQEMKKIAQAHQFSSLIIPVRPSLKHLYPLTPIERYITWQNENKLPFDPWLRIHAKQGAKLIKVCSQSFSIIDTVSNWEARANMRFPESGDYIIPGALVPIKIDYANDQGSYIEPNVWMSYNLN